MRRLRILAVMLLFVVVTGTLGAWLLEHLGV